MFVQVASAASTMESEDSDDVAVQSTNLCNKHLPYADLLKDEATVCWSRIKEQLAKSVMLGDIKSGAAYWSERVSQFVKHYGHSFSKEDHIRMIHLLYKLVTIPDLEVSLIQKFGDALIDLIRKWKLLSRDDLALPWRPLYQLFMRTVYSKRVHVGLQYIPSGSQIVHQVIRACRTYFVDEATQEMLNEWQPWMSPLGGDMARAVRLLESFLPTTLPPGRHHMGFGLWFKEMMDWYEGSDSAPHWEKNMVNLLSRVAQNNIGHIDWTPHASAIFSRVLKSFVLPVGPSYLQAGITFQAYDTKMISGWIVAMIDTGNVVMKYIEKLIKALESYYHPSNHGSWTKRLEQFMGDLVDAFVRRVSVERYRKRQWYNFIPDDKKLTDDQITEFVNIMKTVVFLSMFSKHESHGTLVAVNSLACLRPEVVIPELVNRLFQSLETVTEPHRLYATLMTTMVVARPMVDGGHWYPEGKLHILPIFNLVLPGIDANDPWKTLGTLNVIRVLAVLIAIVDCSAAPQWHGNLSDSEIELCSQTAQFEDIVFQFIDRLFILIENSAIDHQVSAAAVEKGSMIENCIEDAVLTAASTVFRKLSVDIFKAAFDKLLTYLKGNVFEVLVSGRLAAGLALTAVEASPELALPLLLPYCCDRICQLAHEHRDAVGGSSKRALDEERLDQELQWLLLLLSECMQCDGASLLTYVPALESVLDCTLHLTPKEGYEYAALMLRRLLKSLLRTYPIEKYNVDKSIWDKPLSEYLPIKDWGAGGDLHTMHVEWHVPSKEELLVASALVNKYLAAELAALEAVTSGKAASMDRHELERRLVVVNEILLGSGVCLSEWSTEAVKLSEYAAVETTNTMAYAGMHVHDITLNGCNTRQRTLEVIRPLLDHLLTHPGADSAKPLLELVDVYGTLLFEHGATEGSMNDSHLELISMKRWTSSHLTKKRHLRVALVEHIRLQHQLRLRDCISKVFTTLHRDAYSDLFQLATSQYDNVRKKAQSVLCRGFDVFQGSHKVILQDIVSALTDNQSNEQQFKGVLRLVHGDAVFTLAANKDWDTIRHVWPALVCSCHSEKPDIQALVDNIKKLILDSYETPALVIAVTAECAEAAKVILNSEQIATLDTIGALRLTEERHASWRSAYDSVSERLASLIESKSLHWKRHECAVRMLASQVRHDVITTSDLCKLFARNLLHDSHAIRKFSVKATTAIMFQQKPKSTKKWLSCNASNCPSGFPSLQSLRYRLADAPDSKEKWNSTTFVDKARFGQDCHYQLLLYQDEQSTAPSEIVKDDDFVALLGEAGSVSRLLRVMSLENAKEEWDLNAQFFKGLFRNYGAGLLEYFKVPLQELVQDTCQATEGGRHRCLSQVLIGIVRGSKHWFYDNVMSMWDWLLPFLKVSIRNVSSESVDAWSTFFAQVTKSRDTRKFFRMFNFLFEEIADCNARSSSLELTSRLRYLHCSLDQRDWRIAELLERCLTFVQAMMTHPFQTVRNRIGRFLVTVFQHDSVQPGWSENTSPRRDAFSKVILPNLDLLKERYCNSSNELSQSPSHDMSNEAAVECRAKAMLLIKTVLVWLDTNFARGVVRRQWSAGVISFMPLIFPLVSDVADNELRLDCFQLIARMPLPALPVELTAHWLDAIEDASKSQSWQGRALLLAHLQSFIFQNLFSIGEPQVTSRVSAVLLRLLADEQIEVRQIASVTISGVLQCGYLHMDDAMLTHFYRLSAAPAKASTAKSSEGISDMAKRHAGVLGISACIRSCPYDVPGFLPDLLMRLSQHTHDPQPIQKTVKETMAEFKRTHYDNWSEHKLKFSDDQLVILTDMLVSQNYYA